MVNFELCDGIWIYDLPNTGRAFYPLELRRTHGERGHILGSYLTRVLHTARISKVDVVHALIRFATSSILALKDNFWRSKKSFKSCLGLIQVNLFLQIWKFLMFLVSTPSKLVLSCTYIIMMLSLFLLLKSFKLEIRLINIQPDTLTFTDLRPVEQILQKFRSGLKVLEYGIHYRTTSKTPRLLIYSSVWSNHF